MAAALDSTLRARRQQRGWTQQLLADKARISRQSYVAIEAGRSIPATDVALRLARALDVPVELLFCLAGEEPGALEAEDGGLAPATAGRVRLARFGERLVAHQLEAGGLHASLLADGVAGEWSGGLRSVRLLGGHRPPPDLVVAGCDPAFGLVARELEERGLDVLLLPAGSEAALRALARGVVHVAGVHLCDPETGEYNGPWVRRLLPFPALRISFAVWEEVLAVAAGNPLGIGGVADLTRPGLRLLNREPGSGARALLEQRLDEAGIPAESITGFCETAARSHGDVAGAIASGAADAGVAVWASARSRGLEGLPLAQEPYELVVPQHFADTPAFGALLCALRARRTRRQVEALGGYDASAMGRVA